MPKPASGQGGVNPKPVATRQAKHGLMWPKRWSASIAQAGEAELRSIVAEHAVAGLPAMRPKQDDYGIIIVYDEETYYKTFD